MHQTPLIRNSTAQLYAASFTILNPRCPCCHRLDSHSSLVLHNFNKLSYFDLLPLLTILNPVVEVVKFETNILHRQLSDSYSLPAVQMAARL